MKRIFLTTLMTATLGTAGALAAGPDHPHPPLGKHGGPAAMFDRTDTNGDGIITQDEAKAHRGTMFDKLDRNDDGFLDDAEKRLGKHKRHAKQKMHRAERKADRHLALDTDKDGKVSLSEFEAISSPMFTKMDSNGDGAISAKEHKAAKRKAFERMDSNSDGFLTKDDKKQHHEQRHAKMQKHGAAIDANDDGRISRAEFVDAESPMFAHLDQNKDGQITREEAENAPMHKKGMHGQRGKH